jgi:hypothetical protein
MTSILTSEQFLEQVSEKVELLGHLTNWGTQSKTPLNK